MLGAPGSGKGTQAAKISEKYSIPRISTGDIFRKNIQEGTQLGVKAREYIDKGLLVPDEVTDGIVEGRILEKDCKDGFILDGYPRTVAQAESLERMLEKADRNVDIALNIAVPDEEVVHRLSGRRVCKCGETYHVDYNPPKKKGVCDKCGGELYVRDDDKPETVKKRLAEYHEKSSPLTSYYRGCGVLVEIDGKPDPDTVKSSIEDVLEERGYLLGGE